MQRKAFHGIVAVGLVVVGGLLLSQWYMQPKSGTARSDLPELASGEARVLFEFNGDGERVFDGPVVQGMSVLDTLRQSAKAGKFSFEYKMESGKVYVGAINGFTGDRDSGWRFSVNGKALPQEMLEVQRVQEGDVIEVRYSE